MQGDLIVAETGALIGFAGPRVIQDTIKQKLPKGFQSAEFLLEKGMIDCIVRRHELKETLALVLDFLIGNERECQKNADLRFNFTPPFGKFTQKLKEFMTLTEEIQLK